MMIGFILGAVAGAAGYWAYQRYIVGSDDDAFADFETSSLDRPTTDSYSAPTSTSSPSSTTESSATEPSSTSPSSSS